MEIIQLAGHMARKKGNKKEVSLDDYESVYKRIGKELRRLRIDAGYTSSLEFAYENDLSPSQYGRYEAGSNMKMESLLKVLSKHGISIEDFFKGMK